MAEDLAIIEGTRQQKYEILLPQLVALMEGETDIVANCANVAAALRQTFGFFWVGFYFVKEDELVLGPFQGDIACTRIQKGRGVCGRVWENAAPLIVADVENFPGHIACSAASKSEIVIPIIKNNKVRSVLDVDSDELDDFNAIDQTYLEKVANLIAPLF